LIDSMKRQVGAKFFEFCVDCKVGATTCSFEVMKAAALVMLLVITLALRLAYVIPAFADPSDVGPIFSLFED